MSAHGEAALGEAIGGPRSSNRTSALGQLFWQEHHGVGAHHDGTSRGAPRAKCGVVESHRLAARQRELHLAGQDFQATKEWYLARLGSPGSARGTWQGCHPIVNVPYPHEGWQWATNSDSEWTTIQLSVDLADNVTEIHIVSQTGPGHLSGC